MDCVSCPSPDRSSSPTALLPAGGPVLPVVTTAKCSKAGGSDAGPPQHQMLHIEILSYSRGRASLPGIGPLLHAPWDPTATAHCCSTPRRRWSHRHRDSAGRQQQEAPSEQPLSGVGTQAVVEHRASSPQACQQGGRCCQPAKTQKQAHPHPQRQCPQLAVLARAVPDQKAH